MSLFFARLLDRYPRRSQRLLELLPGLTSWSMILFPVWGSFVWPVAVAYFIIAFDVYWLYRSVSMAIMSLLSFFRIKAALAYNWMADVRGFADWKEVFHVVTIPTYKEPGSTLIRTLDGLVAQTIGAKQIIPIIAFEKRAGQEINAEREKMLREKFGGVFEELLFSYHPANIAGEVMGKSSNAAWAGKTLEKELTKHKYWDVNKMTISSVDSDVVLNHNYFAALTYEFMDNPRRYRRIWQGAILFYNNIERIPWLMRTFNRMASVIQMAILMRPDRLINFSTYSLSLKLMREIGYWDTDVIPEDYRVFFKAYFSTSGEVEVDPIFLPIYADAAESFGFWKTFVNTYEQVKRWAWGASDDSYIIKQYIRDTKAPFWDKTIRVLKVLEDHFLWPVNWFVITLGANLPPLLNPVFSRSVIGRTLPQVSSAILTMTLLSLVVLVMVDWRLRPDVKKLPLWRKLFSPFELLLLPVVGFLFTALPGLDAHTRLMMGRYIEYRVTEKV